LIAIGESLNDRLDAVGKILRTYAGENIYAYEKNSTWYIGIDTHASLIIDPHGKKGVSEGNGVSGVSKIESVEDVKELVTEFTTLHAAEDRMVFGQIGFNYSAYTNNFDFRAGSWPLICLVAPRLQVRVSQGAIQLFSCSEQEFRRIEAALSQAVPETMMPLFGPDLDVDNGYREAVRRALSDIKRNEYSKIIVSRALDLSHRVDMVQTLLDGRRLNTPRRTFLFNHDSYSAVGFSPELVMSCEGGKVTTEPLAGTRANTGTVDEKMKARRELLDDPKEIMEHIMSVQEAIKELRQVCIEDTVVVSDLMSVKERGKVQHLASTVIGKLRRSKNAWDAFHVLFPAITASGIPKMASIEAIHRLETRPRELYSGAIMFFDGPSSMEAALVLRSAFQDPERSWVQAGAGIISLSNPDREFMETCEKLRSFAPCVAFTGIENVI
jgi:salicylate synthetase